MAGRSDMPYSAQSDIYMWADGGWWGLPLKWKGVMHVICPDLSCESFSTVTDGCSNTLAIGEKHAPHDYPNNLDTYWAASGIHSTSAAEPFSASLIAGVEHFKCHNGVPNSKICYYGWGSYHSSGINWLLCDGSARFISTNVNVNLFCDLATIAGGEVAQAP
jgi:prepilin-type processing-associated H-X9-DG protein